MSLIGRCSTLKTSSSSSSSRTFFFSSCQRRRRISTSRIHLEHHHVLLPKNRNNICLRQINIPTKKNKTRSLPCSRKHYSTSLQLLLSKRTRTTLTSSSSSISSFKRIKHSSHHHSIRWMTNNNSTKTKTKIKTKNKINKEKKIIISKNETTPKAFVIGSIAGMLGSLAGMGGGFVMIPLMTSTSRLGLGISQHVAHGTSLFAVAATGIAGFLSYHQSNAVDTTSAIAITSCAMISVRFGANVATKLSERLLKQILGFFMIGIAPLVSPAFQDLIILHGTNKEKRKDGDRDSEEMMENGNHVDSSTNNKQNNTTTTNTTTTDGIINMSQETIQKVITSGAIGLGSGFTAGLFGVGGGAIVVPALILCTDMDHHTALGTSLGAMTLPAIVGTFTHYQNGNVNLRVAPMLAMGSFVGAYFGGKIGMSIEENTLKWGFSSLMVTLGFKTLIRV